MAGENVSLVDGFDSASLIRNDLERISGQEISLLVFTDSAQGIDMFMLLRYTN